jgi:hypothetical protein
MLLPTYTVSSPFVVPPRPALTRRGLFVLGVTLLPLRHWGRGFAADDDRLNAQIRPHTSEVRASWSPPTQLGQHLKRVPAPSDEPNGAPSCGQKSGPFAAQTSSARPA